MKRFGETVLLGAPGGHVQRPRARGFQPRSHRLGCELRAVVAPHSQRGRAASGHLIGQDLLDVTSRHAPSRIQRHAFTSILIDQTEPLQSPPVICSIKYNVSCTYLVISTRRFEVTSIHVLAMRKPFSRLRTSETWARRAAGSLGLQSTLRPRGRPSKTPAAGRPHPARGESPAPQADRERSSGPGPEGQSQSGPIPASGRSRSSRATPTRRQTSSIDRFNAAEDHRESPTEVPP